MVALESVGEERDRQEETEDEANLGDHVFGVEIKRVSGLGGLVSLKMARSCDASYNATRARTRRPKGFSPFPKWPLKIVFVFTNGCLRVGSTFGKSAGILSFRLIALKAFRPNARDLPRVCPVEGRYKLLWYGDPRENAYNLFCPLCSCACLSPVGRSRTSLGRGKRRARVSPDS